MPLLSKAPWLMLLVSLPIVAHAEFVRCTSADGKSSTLQRGKCASPDDTQTPVTPTKPLLKRDPANTQLIRCTSPDGKNVSIQRGNCAAPEDSQTLLE